MLLVLETMHPRIAMHGANEYDFDHATRTVNKSKHNIRSSSEESEVVDVIISEHRYEIRG